MCFGNISPNMKKPIGWFVLDLLYGWVTRSVKWLQNLLWKEIISTFLDSFHWWGSAIIQRIASGSIWILLSLWCCRRFNTRMHKYMIRWKQILIGANYRIESKQQKYQWWQAAEWLNKVHRNPAHNSFIYNPWDVSRLAEFDMRDQYMNTGEMEARKAYHCRRYYFFSILIIIHNLGSRVPINVESLCSRFKINTSVGDFCI